MQSEYVPYLTPQERVAIDCLLSDTPAIVSITDSFEGFCSSCLKIQDKDDLVSPLHLNRAQQHFTNTVREQFEQGNRFHLLIKSRRVGMSTGIQALKFYRQYRSPLRAMTMAHDQDTTDMLRRMSQLYYDKLPNDIDMDRILDNAATTIYMPNRSTDTIATAGGKAKGRGGGYNFFHGSEVAFWINTEKIIAGALQGLTKHGLCIFETTVNGAQGWVWDTVQKPGKWIVHFYAWWWDEDNTLPHDGSPLEYTGDELECIEKARADGFELTPGQILWRRDKQAELPLLFPQEYPEDIVTAFLTSGLSVFGDFESCLKTPEQTKPNDKHRYVGGIDWGQTDDYTALSIMDARTGEEVHLERWRRIAPETQIDLIIEAALKWRCELINPELNSMGLTFASLLSAKIERSEAPISVSGFMTTNDSKRRMADGLAYAIRNGLLTLLPDTNATSELRTFVQTQTKNGLYTYGHIPGSKDDTVIARMAAWDAACNLIW